MSSSDSSASNYDTDAILGGNATLDLARGSPLYSNRDSLGYGNSLNMTSGKIATGLQDDDDGDGDGDGDGGDDLRSGKQRKRERQRRRGGEDAGDNSNNEEDDREEITGTARGARGRRGGRSGGGRRGNDGPLQRCARPLVVEEKFCVFFAALLRPYADVDADVDATAGADTGGPLGASGESVASDGNNAVSGSAGNISDVVKNGASLTTAAVSRGKARGGPSSVGFTSPSRKPPPLDGEWEETLCLPVNASFLHRLLVPLGNELERESAAKRGKSVVTGAEEHPVSSVPHLRVGVAEVFRQCCRALVRVESCAAVAPPSARSLRGDSTGLSASAGLSGSAGFAVESVSSDGHQSAAARGADGRELSGDFRQSIVALRAARALQIMSAILDSMLARCRERPGTDLLPDIPDSDLFEVESEDAAEIGRRRAPGGGGADRRNAFFDLLDHSPVSAGGLIFRDLCRGICAGLGSADDVVRAEALRFLCTLLGTGDARIYSAATCSSADVQRGQNSSAAARSRSAGSSPATELRGERAVLDILVPVLMQLKHNWAQGSSDTDGADLDMLWQRAWYACGLLLSASPKPARHKYAARLVPKLFSLIRAHVEAARAQSRTFPPSSTLWGSLSSWFEREASELRDWPPLSLDIQLLVYAQFAGIVPAEKWLENSARESRTPAFALLISSLGAAIQNPRSDPAEAVEQCRGAVRILRRLVDSRLGALEQHKSRNQFLVDIRSREWPASALLFLRERSADSDGRSVFSLREDTKSVTYASPWTPRFPSVPLISSPSITLEAAVLDFVAKVLVRHTSSRLPCAVLVDALQLALALLYHRLDQSEAKSLTDLVAGNSKREDAVPPLQFDWMKLWSALFSLLRLVTQEKPGGGEHVPIYQRVGGVVHLCAVAGLLLDMMICYGQACLLSSEHYDELFYEIVRNSEIVWRVVSVLDQTDQSDALRGSALAQWDNIRAICTHYAGAAAAASSDGQAATASVVKESIAHGYSELNLRLFEPSELIANGESAFDVGISDDSMTGLLADRAIRAWQLKEILMPSR